MTVRGAELLCASVPRLNASFTRDTAAEFVVVANPSAMLLCTTVHSTYINIGILSVSVMQAGVTRTSISNYTA